MAILSILVEIVNLLVIRINFSKQIKRQQFLKILFSIDISFQHIFWVTDCAVMLISALSGKSISVHL